MQPIVEIVNATSVDDLCSRCHERPRVKPRRVCTTCRNELEKERRVERIADAKGLPCGHAGCPQPREVTASQVRPFCVGHMREYGRAAQRKAARDAGVPERPFRPDGPAPDGQGWCSGHQAYHPVAEFYVRKGRSSNVQSSCKQWQYAQYLLQYEQDPEAMKAKARESARKNRKRWIYGLSDDEYADMVVAQRGCCASCTLPHEALVVDHDHAHADPKSREAVRGLLCPSCNWGEGHLKSDPEKMLRLAWYTAHHGDMAGVEEFLARTSLS